ncbi:MAG TPA: flagellar basal body rod protein FlgB [Plasticicumulans sp.]|uniref:flagellar basal body rod protein FlgB n=1 Tax=Plasticicumulans sp. TaxID=2307179 RepID=UPI000FBE2075|nr:flagellar basal body rod protein FlgB [Plasticicumulans sp.]RTK95671.1 MAG: flagellar basal body rod protein FlgB [Xanthomonadales bacterium]HMV39720.1 flagellar basal body rod protein FlgB [Plasticicumulans sp.]HMW31203.1 flagellar basal body rod protein FlgB [Plasticicumulans sp.]HMW41387.1 flagellar basal body rod protein FlgB [Plasticicumulans sp.]HMZ10900.1 flagellar basal body rod protein FlgB [Plasticicumulans sp.]
MAIRFDRVLGVHEDAMRLRAQRTEVIAANLANADTPNYQAQDIDFAAAIRDAQGGARLAATAGAHIQPGEGRHGLAGTLFRESTQPSIDGNTVEPEREKAMFGENAVQYTASLRLLGDRLQGLLTAIRGE